MKMLKSMLAVLEIETSPSLLWNHKEQVLKVQESGDCVTLDLGIGHALMGYSCT